MKGKFYFRALYIIIMLIIQSCRYDNNPGIREAINGIRMIDTHEHFSPEAVNLKNEADFFTMVIGYLQADMISAGMNNEELTMMLDLKKPFNEKWEIFSRWWEHARNTAYAECFRLTMKDLFGKENIDEVSASDINMKLKEMRKPGWYRHVLKERSGIDVSIVDPLGNDAEDLSAYPKDFFVTVKRFDSYLRPTAKSISALEGKMGFRINTLEDYIAALDNDFRKGISDGIVAIKSGIAYSRILYFEDIPREKAEVLFLRLKKNNSPLSIEERKMFEDHMMHQIVARAEKYSLPIQIHTGILSRNFNNSNPVENLNAIHLSNLFLKYRKAKFVIFHGSYPYMSELAYLAKHYPNVYIDMCWMHIISPASSKIYLEEWLLTVPSNKITGFGGDVSVEWATGHSIMARKVITEVLGKMVNDGHYTENVAISIGRKLLRQNAIDLYNLENTNGEWYRKRNSSPETKLM